MKIYKTPDYTLSTITISLFWFQRGINPPNRKKEAEMSQTPTVPPYVNRAMKFVLRSPVHGMVSKSILLITFTGRRTGKTYTTPVSYSQQGDQVTIFTHADWWKNLRSGAPVTLRIQGREIQGLAEPVVEDKPAIAAKLAEHLREVPFDARYYGVTFDDQNNPRVEEVENAVQSVAMISVRLC
jgi:deazaflavin-dependent oxidoreductase (nitroreductase family)